MIFENKYFKKFASDKRNVEIFGRKTQIIMAIRRICHTKILKKNPKNKAF